ETMWFEVKTIVRSREGGAEKEEQRGRSREGGAEKEEQRRRSREGGAEKEEQRGRSREGGAENRDKLLSQMVYKRYIKNL
ncbi:hypothetical protein QTP70_000150, partial [Hemibagrus guttatus]